MASYEQKGSEMSELRTPEVENLLSVFAKLNDNDTVFALLEDLFTIREIRETSQRLAVARLLSSGKPYSAIEEAPGASATTIARVSKCLSYGSGGYAAGREALGDQKEYPVNLLALGACGEHFQDELGARPDERRVLVEKPAHVA